MATGQDYQIEQLGVFSPKPVPVESLGVGEAGFMVANIKNVADAKIGDTITEIAPADRDAVSRLQGTEADGLRRAVSGRGLEVRRAARGAREAAAERRVVLLRARDVGGARASASAAASSACCTWRSCRSGSSASSTMDLITTAPGVLYRVTTTDGDGARDRQPGEAAGDRAASRRSKSRSSRR